MSFGVKPDIDTKKPNGFWDSFLGAQFLQDVKVTLLRIVEDANLIE